MFSLFLWIRRVINPIIVLSKRIVNYSLHLVTWCIDCETVFSSFSVVNLANHNYFYIKVGFSISVVISQAHFVSNVHVTYSYGARERVLTEQPLKSFSAQKCSSNLRLCWTPPCWDVLHIEINNEIHYYFIFIPLIFWFTMYHNGLERKPRISRVRIPLWLL